MDVHKHTFKLPAPFSQQVPRKHPKTIKRSSAAQFPELPATEKGLELALVSVSLILFLSLGHWAVNMCGNLLWPSAGAQPPKHNKKDIRRQQWSRH